MTPRHMLVSAAIVAGAFAMSPRQATSPATKRAREVVALINTATPAAIRAYVDSAFAGRMRTLPMGAHIDFFMGQHEQSGGFDWVEVQEEPPGRTTALLKQKLTGDYTAIAVQVEAAAPYRIAGIGGDRKSTRLNSSHANISYA